MKKPRPFLPWLLAAAGLAARLGYSWTHPAPINGAEALHDRLAWNLLQGRGYSWDGEHPFFYPAPLYPGLLAGVYAVAGRTPRLASLLQSALDGASPPLAYLIALPLFGPAPALGALALAALYPAFWTFAGRLYLEAALTLATTAFAWAAVRALRTRRTSDWALAGLVLALATSLRSHTILLPVAALPFMLKSKLPRPWKAWAVFSVCSLLPLLPWCVRNSLLLRRPYGLSSGAGTTLWLGSHWAWEGSWPTPHDELGDVLAAAGKGYPEFFEPETDARLGVLARERIAAEPLRFAGLMVRKVFYFWVGNRYFLFGPGGDLAEAFADDCRQRGRLIAVYSVLRRFLLLPLLLALAAWSAWIERRRWREFWPLLLIPAYWTAVHMVLVVESGRYAIPVLPCVFVLAGTGAARLVRRAIEGKWGDA